MSGVQYVGEHLLPGQIGHIGVIGGFVAALMAAAAYGLATNRRNLPDARGWLMLGRVGFALHGIGVFTIIGVMFYVMINKYYEYNYAFSHVSDDLPFKYVFSAFWEGQEGSFLLWMFWHVVLGAVVWWKGGRWEAPVLAVLALIEAFLMSMILGIHITDDIRIGSNPTLLVRDVMQAPIFAQSDYVEKLARLADGLNPLLQNYWMTIHPPTLFLGFASVSIPFAYAIAGLWTADHKAWMKPALPWALFSGAILGTGILMGGAWAYEALSFGGYWAWDPVENMSLVPWMVLVAGVHTHLVARSTGYSIRTTYVFYILSFVLVLYSTFLTRSGILGESSAHAFTEMGLEWQLVAFVGAFLGLGLVALTARWRSVPAPQSEESMNSREFWMFIGALVLMMGAVLITAATSLPVVNAIIEIWDPTFPGWALEDPEAHHNKFQLWIGFFIALLSGISQLMRYRGMGWKGYAPSFYRHLALAGGGAILLMVPVSLVIKVSAWQYGMLLWASLFAVIHNADYLWSFMRSRLKQTGSVVSHLGFALMLIGVLASGLNKEFISTNPLVQRNIIEGATEDELARNVLLLKNSPLFMSGYEVTYVSDSLDGQTRSFRVDFKKVDENGNPAGEQFSLTPNLMYNKGFDQVAASNPSTKRYALRDIFTHIAGASQEITSPATALAREDSLGYEPYALSAGDTVFTSTAYAVLEEITTRPVHPEYVPKPNDLALGLRMKVFRLDTDTVYDASPAIVLRENLVFNYPVQINDLQLKIRLPQTIFEQYFQSDESLTYRGFVVPMGGSFETEGFQFTLERLNRSPIHPNYSPEPGDIAVSAVVRVDGEALDTPAYLEPLYLIRNSSPFNIKDVDDELGLHLRFERIDPQAETFSMSIAREEKREKEVTIEIAEKVGRADYIVLEAIEFPGINFFWLGASMMMLGMVVSMVRRLGPDSKTRSL